MRFLTDRAMVAETPGVETDTKPSYAQNTLPVQYFSHQSLAPVDAAEDAQDPQLSLLSSACGLPRVSPMVSTYWTGEVRDTYV